MKTLCIIAIAGLASPAAADAALTANPDYAGHNTGPRGHYIHGSLNVDVDFDHWDLNLDPDNVVLSIDIGALLGVPQDRDIFLTGLGWDTTINSFGASWLSESSYDFAGQIFLNPGAGYDFPGTGSYTSGGIIDFTDHGLPDILLVDNILTIEMFDSFDDVPDAIDSHQIGTLTLIIYFPIPAPTGLAVLGLGGLVAARRRR